MMTCSQSCWLLELISRITYTQKGAQPVLILIKVTWINQITDSVIIISCNSTILKDNFGIQYGHKTSKYPAIQVDNRLLVTIICIFRLSCNFEVTFKINLYIFLFQISLLDRKIFNGNNKTLLLISLLIEYIKITLPTTYCKYCSLGKFFLFFFGKLQKFMIDCTVEEHS